MTPKEQPSDGHQGKPSANHEVPLAERRALQRLEQEQATFEQKKMQDARWFILKLAMGVLAALIIPTIVGICASILLDQTQTESVKILAASTLFVDILGFAATLWRVVLNAASVTQLAPVTEAVEELPIPIDRKSTSRARIRKTESQEPTDDVNPPNA